MRRAEKKLKKAQRELSRKQKGSRNRAKARMKVARAHAAVADARKEFHHQLSTQLILDNQAVAVEDLAVSGLARTRLAKSVHDAGWSQFVGMLRYKAARYGRTFVKIGRFEPTGIGLRSAGKTGTCPGTARRNRKPRNPRRKPCRVAAQQQVGTARILGLQPEEHVKPDPRASSRNCWARAGTPWCGAGPTRV
uniref:RNA-guided endonuclease InsQ/TnpB family protein n=1 Tax=Streptomyces sp. SS7 TaxID=3108485 RepID=UPI00404021E5